MKSGSNKVFGSFIMVIFLIILTGTSMAALCPKNVNTTCSEGYELQDCKCVKKPEVQAKTTISPVEQPVLSSVLEKRKRDINKKRKVIRYKNMMGQKTKK
jgi:hypothetical protein